MLRKTPIKRTAGTLNRNSTLKSAGKGLNKANKTLKKGSGLKSKPVSEEVKNQRKEQQEADWKFYSQIWSEREHKCIVCNRYLGEEINKACIDHLIEKSSHPELRYESENVVLVCIDHHAAKTNGFCHLTHQIEIDRAKIRFNT